jgi:hypothetical protein
MVIPTMDATEWLQAHVRGNRCQRGEYAGHRMDKHTDIPMVFNVVSVSPIKINA